MARFQAKMAKFLTKIDDFQAKIAKLMAKMADFFIIKNGPCAGNRQNNPLWIVTSSVCMSKESNKKTFLHFFDDFRSRYA